MNSTAVTAALSIIKSASDGSRFSLHVASKVHSMSGKGTKGVLSMVKKNVGDLTSEDLKGKHVFVRANLNVQLDDNKNITKDTKICAAIPTMKFLIVKGAKVILHSFGTLIVIRRYRGPIGGCGCGPIDMSGFIGPGLGCKRITSAIPRTESSPNTVASSGFSSGTTSSPIPDAHSVQLAGPILPPP